VSGFEQDPEAYFDVIIERAIRIMASRPTDVHPQAFWRMRVGKAWRNVYQHMTRPSDTLASGLVKRYQRETADRFAALACEAAMAALSLSNMPEGVKFFPDEAAHEFLEMWERMPPSV
jgi:citrate synthase